MGVHKNEGRGWEQKEEETHFRTWCIIKKQWAWRPERGEQRATAVPINTTLIHSLIHNSILLIWYQYLLKGIDYVMVYSVTAISQMHFLHLNGFMFVLVNRPQWHKNPTSLLLQTGFVNIALRKRSITDVTLQPTDGLQICFFFPWGCMKHEFI